MANEKSLQEQPAKPSFFKNTLPLILFIIIFTLIVLDYLGYIDLQSIGRSIKGGVLETYPFIGNWISVSPATYYIKDIDGERYAKVIANFQLNITYDGKYYIGSSSMSSISSQPIGDSNIPIINFENPLAFDGRNYMNLNLPYPGISEVEIYENKMTVTTPLSGGTQKIVFNLVKSDSSKEGRDTLYGTALVVGSARGQAMGEESDENAFVLVRR